MINLVWNTSVDLPRFEQLKHDLKTDVLIIGGGLTGILTAYKLSELGVQFALVEANTICRGVTLNTTAKITSQHALIYSKIYKEYGLEKAQMYYKSNQEALEEFKTRCKNIDCDFEEKSAYVYSLNRSDKINDELDVLNKIKAEFEYKNKIDLPLNIAGKVVNGWPRLCLNGKPYFFNGLLDQGYWPESLLTAPAPESYVQDILAMKKLGYNTLRKHIKVEAEEFYYQCDKLGMIVWQDMVNNSDYNFNRDTALPTAGFLSIPDKYLHRDQLHRSRFLMSMIKTVLQLRNHPAVCYWTIFNEGWGQFDADYVCEEFKKLDDTRFVDATSGWFLRKNSDVDSRHVYFKKVKLKGNGKKPLVLSEFGGKTYSVKDHIFNPDKTYGYGGCESLLELDIAVSGLYKNEILPCIGRGLCAAIYTQVSDVEDEINGLLTYDRKVEKMDPATMVPLAQAMQKAIEE